MTMTADVCARADETPQLESGRSPANTSTAKQVERMTGETAINASITSSTLNSNQRFAWELPPMAFILHRINLAAMTIAD